MADLSRKAIPAGAADSLKDAIPQPKIQPENIESIIEALTTGRVTHDYPITVEEAIGCQSRVGCPILQINGVLSTTTGDVPACSTFPCPIATAAQLYQLPREGRFQIPLSRCEPGAKSHNFRLGRHIWQWRHIR